MTKRAYDKITAGLNDAIAFAEGDTTRGRVVAGPDIKAIRGKVKLSQAAFAEKLHISAATLRDWEQGRSEEHTSELQSLMRISYAVFCLKKKKTTSTVHATRDLVHSHCV